MRHTTTWEDDRLAGIACDGVAVDLVLSAEEDDTLECPQCKTRLRLKWDVSIEEVEG